MKIIIFFSISPFLKDILKQEKIFIFSHKNMSLFQIDEIFVSKYPIVCGLYIFTSKFNLKSNMKVAIKL